MKQLTIVLGVVVATLIMTGTAGASIGSFVAIDNQFGYSGTITDTTPGAATPVTGTVPTPMDGYLYFTNNASVVGYGANANTMQTNAAQSPGSNMNPGFFQINELGTTSVTSATGFWTDPSGNPSLWDFTVIVTGANATWASSLARLYRPNVADAQAPGGIFSTYTYTMTFTGMTTTIDPGSGWRYNTDDPTGYSGSFSGSFVATTTPVMGGGTPITGSDTYAASLNLNGPFSNSGFTGPDDQLFASPLTVTVVPEPATVIVWSVLGLGWALGVCVWRRRKVA